MKVQGNSGETQHIKWRETGGKLINIFLRNRKVQGNWGETQKYIFKAYKSAGKLRGNSKIHF